MRPEFSQLCLDGWAWYQKILLRCRGQVIFFALMLWSDLFALIRLDYVSTFAMDLKLVMAGPQLSDFVAIHVLRTKYL